MRLGRFQIDGSTQPFYGEIDGDTVHRLAHAPFQKVVRSGESHALTALTLLPPTEPTKIVCVGLNYRKHAEEMGKGIPKEPLLFIKPSTAVNRHGAPIEYPPESEEVHHEAELGLVIGRRLKRAGEAEAADAIFALTCINDVTARDIQRREIQHTRAKSFDTFAPCGPWMVRGLSPRDLRIQCRVNGQTRQDGRTGDMIFAPARLLSFISQVMTLLPGDLVSTGTPPGVGAINPGDAVEVEIEGIGTLANPVQRAS